MSSFEVGDIVFFEKWKLCIWEVTKIELSVLQAIEVATLKLLGGRALPPDWNEVAHAATEKLVHAERFLNEMEILAWAALELVPLD